MDTIAKISTMDNLTQLEALGSTLTLRQAQDLLNSYHLIEESDHWKMSPLFSNLPHELFITLLLHANEKQLEILKKESMADAIQHNFTMLSNTANLQMHELFNEIDTLEKEITRLNIQDVGVTDLAPIETQIEEIAEQHQELIAVIDKGLTLAWNTNRSDVIESLSTIKERLQRSLNMAIGHGPEGDTNSTGLYSLLEKRLFSVYGDITNPLDIKALADDAPAFEALIRFGITSLKDYSELGMLSDVEDPELEEVKLKQLTENERVKKHTELMESVKQHLAELGLMKIRDLKDAYIFSKKSLTEYLTLD